MMPEHINLLGETDWDFHKTNKPELDEHQLQELDEKLKPAVEFQLPVIFELWFDGFTEELEGIVHKIDENKKLIYIREITGYIQKIEYSAIINVEYLD